MALDTLSTIRGMQQTVAEKKAMADKVTYGGTETSSKSNRCPNDQAMRDQIKLEQDELKEQWKERHRQDQD